MFDADEIENAKREFAKAWHGEIKKSRFEADPFTAALTIWNQENGQFVKALWVANKEKWNEDAEVLQYVEEIKEQEERDELSAENEKAAYLKSAAGKNETILKIHEMCVDIMENRFYEPETRIKAAERLAKLHSIDEKPKDNEPQNSAVLNVIHHRLQPMGVDAFSEYSEQQQTALQNELTALASESVEDATVIN